MRKLYVFIQSKQCSAGCKQDGKDSRRNGSLLRILSLCYTASPIYKYLDRIAQFYFLIPSQGTSSYTLHTRFIIIIIKTVITTTDPPSITIPFDEDVLHQPQRKYTSPIRNLPIAGTLPLYQFNQTPIRHFHHAGLRICYRSPGESMIGPRSNVLLVLTVHLAGRRPMEGR